MKKLILRVCTLATALAFLATLSSRAADLTIFAAASLSDALTEISKTYEAKSGDKLHFNFGASSMLARQIKEGAPADLFFSADEAKMDDLAKNNLIAPDTRHTLLSNTLVIVVHAENGASISAPADLVRPDIRRIALAEPQTVPAGIYAREYLQRAGLWSKVSEKIVPTENVRACLAAVESGNADTGIVYKTDALISNTVRIAYAIPTAKGPKITYPLAVTTDSKSGNAARRFAAFLDTPEARDVFIKYGFLAAEK
jgi:molybdate transport system substrate-binding protein